MGKSAWPDDNVILYDGVCIFCSSWVRFVAKRDVRKMFRFTAIQSTYGRKLAEAFNINPENPDTNAVVHGGEIFFKSNAALTVLAELPYWRWVTVLRVVPAPVRDVFYNCIARNRYRIFGKYDECYLGGDTLRGRTLE